MGKQSQIQRQLLTILTNNVVLDESDFTTGQTVFLQLLLEFAPFPWLKCRDLLYIVLRALELSLQVVQLSQLAGSLSAAFLAQLLVFGHFH
jgi:hypothetical protein